MVIFHSYVTGGYQQISQLFVESEGLYGFVQNDQTRMKDTFTFNS